MGRCLDSMVVYLVGRMPQNQRHVSVSSFEVAVVMYFCVFLDVS